MRHNQSVSSRISAASLLLLLLVALPGHAAGVYTCVRDGKPLLTDRPCDNGASATTSSKAPDVTVATAPKRRVPDQRDFVPLPTPKAGNAPNADKPRTTPLSVATSIAQQLLLYAVIIFGGLGVFYYLRRSSRGQWSASPSAPLPPFGSAAPEATPKPSLRLDDEVLPYRPASIMSRYEQVFFHRLREALPEYEVFPQVPLAAFIQIDRKKAGKNFWLNSYRWQNRIGQQRVDYLVCDKGSFTPIAAIELDDPSHETETAGERDQKKNKSLADAQVRLIRWRVERMPAGDEIRSAIISGAGASGGRTSHAGEAVQSP